MGSWDDQLSSFPSGLSLPTVDYYFRPPRPQKPDTGLETDEEKEELEEGRTVPEFPGQPPVQA